MSGRMVGMVLDDPRVQSTGEAAVLAALAERADDRGHCRPGLEEVARRARMTVRSAQRIIRKLQARGLLLCTTGGGRSRANRYLLTPEKPRHQCQGIAPDGEAETPTPVSPFEGANPDASVTVKTPTPVSAFPENPDTSVAKPRHQCHPNRQEPSDDDDERARASEVAQVREAAGVDPSKHLPQAWLDPWVESELGRWKALDLSLPEILTVLRAVTAKRRGAPPSSPTYFAKPLQEAAGAKGAPALTPIEGGHSRAPPVQPIDFAKIWASRGEK